MTVSQKLNKHGSTFNKSLNSSAVVESQFTCPVHCPRSVAETPVLADYPLSIIGFSSHPTPTSTSHLQLFSVLQSATLLCPRRPPSESLWMRNVSTQPA